MNIRRKTVTAHKYSIKKRMAILMTAALSLLIGLLVASNLYATSASNRMIAASNQRALGYSVSQIDANLEHVDDLMNALVASNSDYLTLFGDADPLSAHVASQNLLGSLRSYLGGLWLLRRLFCIQRAQQQLPRHLFRRLRLRRKGPGTGLDAGGGPDRRRIL